jgi:nitrogen fixation/metabolism regulation signal transduction histidine kinase
VSTEPRPDATGRYPLRSTRAFRWAVAVAIAVIMAIGIVLLFLLTQATGNRELYERNYGRLFILNIVVAGLLLLVIAWIGARLFSRLRQGKFGSRLLVKLAAIFALVGFLPGMLIYVVSYQFVSRSIESWFDVKVEGALDAGLSLGRVTLDTLASDLATKTRVAAVQLATQPNKDLGRCAAVDPHARCIRAPRAGSAARADSGQRCAAVERHGPAHRQRGTVAIPAQS